MHTFQHILLPVVSVKLIRQVASQTGCFDLSAEFHASQVWQVDMKRVCCLKSYVHKAATGLHTLWQGFVPI